MDEWEKSLENLTILKELGKGQFGKVFLGTLKEVTQDGRTEEVEVAIKVSSH